MMKKNLKWIIIGVVIILVAFGIYQNPDRKINSAFADYQKIVDQEAIRKNELQGLSAQYKNCFDNPNKEIAQACLVGIEKIKQLASQETKVIDKLNSFYSSNKNALDKDNKLFVENNIKLVTSKEYQDVLKGTIDVLDAHIDLYTFVTEETDTRELDNNLSQDEKIKIASRLIADRNFKSDLIVKNLTDLSENLNLKKELLKRYIRATYSEDFINKLGLAVSSK